MNWSIESFSIYPNYHFKLEDYRTAEKLHLKLLTGIGSELGRGHT